MAEILLEEGDRAGAAELADSGRLAPELIERIADAIRGEAPLRAAELYRKAAGHPASSGRAVSCLRKAKGVAVSTGGEEEWREFIEEFRERYRDQTSLLRRIRRL